MSFPVAARHIHVGCKRRIAGLLLGLFATVFRVLRCAGPRKSGGPSKRVLLLEPYGMGDVLSLGPLVRALKQHGLHVTIAAREKWRDAIPSASYDHWIDCDVPWASYNKRKKYALGAFFRKEFRGVLKALRPAAAPAIGLDPRGDIRSIILLYLAGCREVYGLSRYLGSDLKVLTPAAHLIDYDPEERRYQVNLRIAKALGVPEDAVPSSPPSVAHLTSGIAPAKSVALVPVAPWPGRSWEASKWQAVAAAVRERGFDVVALCGPGQRQLAESCAGTNVSVVECNGIREWIAQLEKSDAVIALNTGPMHLADALGKPLVVIDGPSCLPLWAPSGARTVLVHRQHQLRCAPCHQAHSIRRCKRRCMEAITPQEVTAGLGAALDRRALPMKDTAPADLAFRFPVLAVNVTATTLNDASLSIQQWAADRRKAYVHLCTADTTVQAHDSPRLAEIINGGDMALPDGMPLVWAGRRLGHSMTRVYGPDLMLDVCDHGRSRKLRHFLYGSTPNVLRDLAANLVRRFPGLILAGSLSPPFRQLAEEEKQKIAETIDAANPDIVWVGLGTPKQDLWMGDFRPRLSAPVLVAVGAAFDFHAGHVKQAPSWMGRNGLEWLYRWIQEPARLWRRYLIGNIRFLFLMAKQKRQQDSSDNEH